MEPKKWSIALILSFFLGWLGLHRFYLGYTVIGVIQLLTLGGFGIWVLIDFVLIILNKLPDSKGQALAR